jgi:hypothetical protein
MIFLNTLLHIFYTYTLILLDYLLSKHILHFIIILPIFMTCIVKDEISLLIAVKVLTKNGS